MIRRLKPRKNMPEAGTPEDIEAMGWVSYKEHCEIRYELEKEIRQLQRKLNELKPGDYR